VSCWKTDHEMAVLCILTFPDSCQTRSLAGCTISGTLARE
jgi:hypothetical protein